MKKKKQQQMLKTKQVARLKRKGMKLNILLDFYSLAGDIILVQIDRHTREFKSLTQENILWFTEFLNRRSPNNFNANKYI